ncbi:RnfABCDGE type electron transport complex subunit D [Psychrilyobacter atlanticus]|uniref:RnfABCDGE type electron transport complex subunit D n=1 Tax=Psychrilyobacter atlanticus TaxID=271091 RepID=UPI0004130FB2|nr:RnfABCDGE type electron transport complex subunit D [Psychrilyobacter atlanticus]
MAKLLKMGPSPHVRTSETVEKVMYDVIIALLPALLMAVYVFGIQALTTTLIAVGTCMATEGIMQKIMGKDIDIKDGSAIITGILFAFVVPVTMAYWIVIVGSVISILLGKMLFGGLGHNIFNPALVGRAFVQASWPVAITTFVLDGQAGPTMLDAMKRGLDGTLVAAGNPYVNALLGKMGGTIGETSALALLLGGAYLIYKGQVNWKVPAIIIGTVGVGAFLFGGDPIMHMLSGGLFLGAFFMATDMVTSPYTEKGQMIFAFGIGALVTLIRFKGGYPEGMAYSILIMNGVVPLINKYTKPKMFGGVAK